MRKWKQALVLIAALVFSSAGTAQAAEPQVPIDASFYFEGTTEFLVVETVSTYSASSGTFVRGPTTQVDSGNTTSELWIDTELVGAQPAPTGGWTLTGKITAVRGTEAGARVGEPLTASLLLAPFGIGVTEMGNIRSAGLTESEVTTLISDGNPGEWSLDMGDLVAEGIRIETDDQNQSWLTSSLRYRFEMEALNSSDGISFSATEILGTSEIQGDVPAVEGTVILERTVFYSFNGESTGVEWVPQNSTTAVPAISLPGLILLGFGLVLLAGRRGSGLRPSTER